ncbi:hypothetical protein PPERSA_06719 [Pseudocohnilembus persalinus]|uniref:Uncharacterized protein n=1 Tax=Pseudocohnilembus persalinus TaxID=266149 RepID=A0A0V0QS88_PSEPJ|nr:hypothetical protein PPERSA_06719 [Pseudocohnilembus persalinus]|eukprot:KRX05085.1 hypothetical protein PPERSA_06719 [Pseudocohnilembus persalinus]
MTSLQHKLNALRNAERVNLAEEQIGDYGARQLAEFLKGNKNIRILELNGNDIGPKGIAEIFHALQPSNTIQSVFCEWNKIGLDPEGVNAVAGFILGNRNIQHLGLANNKISGEDLDQLMNALPANNLLSLDLKWNNLGTQGGQKINKMLDNNKKILYIDLNGNNIPDEILDDIDEKLKVNLKSNNIPRDKICGQNDDLDQDSQNNTQQFPERDQPRFNQTQGGDFKESDGVSMIHHLENVLQQERLHTGQIKQRLESELDDLERKDKNHLRTIQDMEQKIGDVQNQNKMMKFDIERLRDEFNIIEKSNIDQIRGYEDRIKQNKYLLEEMEKKHKLNCEKMLQENNYRVKELARDWEARCRAVEERIKAAEIEKNQQEEELRRIEEKSVDLTIRQEQELDDLTKRVQEEEYQKYQANLAAIEARIQAVEEGHDIYLQRNAELIQEYERRDQEGNVELQQYKQELERLEIEHETFLKNNGNFKSLSEKLNSELNIKERAVTQLESEINTLNNQIESKKQFGEQQLLNTKTDQQKERHQWEEEREEKINSIADLENQLKESGMENARLRQEYLKLSELVQANVNKEIFATFQRNNLY